MKFEQIKTNVKKAFDTTLTQYHRLEDYFKNGSFGVKFYPWLMHPCVRHTHNFAVRIIAILTIFAGIYGFFAEFFAALFSEHSLYSVYVKHTNLELALPIGTHIDEQILGLSPLSFSMKAIFLVQAWLFIFFYCIGVTRISEFRFRLLGILFSLFVSLGMWLTYSTNGGRIISGGLHSLGFSSTLIVGGLALIFSALAMVKPRFSRFKRFSFITGLIALSCALIPLFIDTPFLALLNRTSFYAILIWEVALGFEILKEVNR